MQNLRVIVIVTAAIVIACSLTVTAEEKECTHGVDVSCIQAFHEAMAPSCHKYMPEKDYATVRQHVPNMLAEAERIAGFKPDSSYASVMADLEKKRAVYMVAILSLKTAADGDDDAKLKDAFDTMHTAFAEMSGVLSMMPEEVEQFHSVLAKVWHDYLPAEDYEAIKAAIPDLKKHCAAMKAAEIHPAKQAVAKDYAASVEKIEKAIAAVEKVIDSKSSEEIADAVSLLHDGFHAVVVLF